MNNKRYFTPEVLYIDRDTTPEVTNVYCNKPDNHQLYNSPKTLCYDHFPEQWRIPGMVEKLKLISRRMVHLTVLQQSPSRISNEKQMYNAYGSGYITFDPKYGTIIHTSKHVVYDKYEAVRTIVRLFYDEENGIEVNQVITNFEREISRRFNGDVTAPNYLDVMHQAMNLPGLFISLGNCRHFQSVMASDYTSFSCELPIHELFSTEEINQLSSSFSWFDFKVRKLSLNPPKEIDMAIISHPHGCEKKIAFGRMNRFCKMSTAFHDAATCGGSSGAPLIRLKSDQSLSIGHFIHHGFSNEVYGVGFGTLHPPWAFPYIKCFDIENKLTNAINILYEPIFYWTLFFCDMLHLESILISIVDVLAYTSSFSALLFTVESNLFKILCFCFCMHFLCKLALNTWRFKWYIALMDMICGGVSMLMFPVAWLILYSTMFPRPIKELIAFLVWTVILYSERYFDWTYKLHLKTLGKPGRFLKEMLLYNECRVTTRKSLISKTFLMKH